MTTQPQTPQTPQTQQTPQTRSIKFRVWFPDYGFTVYSLFNATKDTIEMSKLDSDIHYYGGEGQPIVQQSTGLKDKNGKEIYEGDIVQDTRNQTYTVYWLDTTASFELARHDFVTTSEPITEPITEPILLSHQCLHQIQVIGNIHEPQPYGACQGGVTTPTTPTTPPF